MSENQPQPVNPATANATQPPVSPLPPATPASEPAKTDADPKLWEPCLLYTSPSPRDS